MNPYSDSMMVFYRNKIMNDRDTKPLPDARSLLAKRKQILAQQRNQGNEKKPTQKRSTSKQGATQRRRNEIRLALLLGKGGKSRNEKRLQLLLSQRAGGVGKTLELSPLDTALRLTQTKNPIFEKFQQMAFIKCVQDTDSMIKTGVLISCGKLKSFSKWRV